MPGEYKEAGTARPTKNIQGQEAPIVIYFMTTSARADARRLVLIASSFTV
jgi:hypothetical protein